jgi:hypothetical protein
MELRRIERAELPLKSSKEIGDEYPAGLCISETCTLGLFGEIAVQPSSAARGPSHGFYFSDDFDFPPTAHPGRELFTVSLVALVILTFVVWGGWTLISL